MQDCIDIVVVYGTTNAIETYFFCILWLIPIFPLLQNCNSLNYFT